jgi:hypothetical protein
MMVLTDSGVVLTGAAEVICPAAAKLYIVRNTTGQSATIKTSAGTGVAIPNGFTSFVFCDGTNVVQAATRIQGASVDFATLKGTGAVVVTNILDEDNMASNSATALATQQSIKAYVDAQIAGNDTLAEILANGNTTGGSDIAVSAGDDITFTDTSKAIFGTGGDLQVYHDGSNSFIVDSGTGALNIQTDALSIKNAAGTETMITATENGGVVLNYDNAARVTTGSAGVSLEGNLSTTGDVRIGILNTDADITTYGTGTLVLSTNEGTNSGTITIAQGVNGNITLDPNGTGKVAIDAALISGGTINGTSVGATTASTGAFTTLTASADSSFTSTGALTISKGTVAQRPGSPTAGMLRFNDDSDEFEGYNGTVWASVGGAALVNDTTTATNLFPLFASATTGTAATLNTSNAKLLYKPSTGELQSSALVASNGIVVNSKTVSSNYTIATGNNASSAGPVTVADGVSVTVSDGSRWVVV